MKQKDLTRFDKNGNCKCARINAGTCKQCSACDCCRYYVSNDIAVFTTVHGVDFTWVNGRPAKL